MLLWVPPDTNGIDPDEKAAKLKREKAARTRKILLGMALFSVAVTVGVTHISTKQQRKRNIKIRQQMKEVIPDVKVLPDDSIYNLQVENQQGEMVSLSQYAGNVSVVVNTACK